MQISDNPHLFRSAANNVVVFRMLMEAKVPIDYEIKNGNSNIFSWIVECGRVENLRLLVEGMREENPQAESVLHQAIHRYRYAGEALIRHRRQ